MSLIKKTSGASPWAINLADLATLFESNPPAEGKVGNWGLTLGQYGGQYFCTLNDRGEERSASGWGRTPRAAVEDLLDQLASPRTKWRAWGKKGRERASEAQGRAEAEAGEAVGDFP